MKKTMAFLFAAVSLASCGEEHPAKFTVRLKDDTGKPVEGYAIHSGTLDYEASLRQGDPAKHDPVWTDVIARTDARGEAVFEYKTLTGMVGVNLFQGLTGNYYLTDIENYQFEKVQDGRWIPENPVIEAVLKRKLNPRPMYVRDFGMGGKTNSEIPGLDKEFGFDLVVSDWMPPHGKGRNPDMFFTLTRKYTDPRNFDASLVVRFPDTGDGLIPAPCAPRKGSELRLDHNAPAGGYQSTFGFSASTPPPDHRLLTNIREDMNYYMRIRTVRDKSGRIISCNYGKIHGDFKFNVTGERKIYFTYYLNPASNDRNIEFDPKRNLFTFLEGAEEVSQP